MSSSALQWGRGGEAAESGGRVSDKLPKSCEPFRESLAAFTLRTLLRPRSDLINRCQATVYISRAVPGIFHAPRRSQSTARTQTSQVLCSLRSAHHPPQRVTKTGYDEISPVTNRASNRVWISSIRR